VIGPKFEIRQFSVQLAAPVTKKFFQPLACQHISLPLGVIDIPERRFIVLWLAAVANETVILGDFPHQYTERPSIGNDVVNGENKHALPGGQPKQTRAKQRG
jgi:hypothetical protein